MSAEFYSSMASAMESMLAQFGADMTLTRNSASPNQKRFSDDTAPTTSATTVTIRGLVKPYPTRMVDGTRIEHSDLMLVADSAEAIAEEDELSYDGLNWKIVSLTKIKPTTVTIGYIAQLRR